MGGGIGIEVVIVGIVGGGSSVEGGGRVVIVVIVGGGIGRVDGGNFGYVCGMGGLERLGEGEILKSVPHFWK